MYNYKNGKWANQILSKQKPNGSWECFHTLRSSSKIPITTEQALTRLEYLGYTEKDECIIKSISYMETLLEELKLPEGNEKSSDFDVFVQLIVSARILRFTKNCENANEVARKWASIITSSFENGTFSQETYDEMCYKIFGKRLKSGRLKDFVNYYHLSILTGFIDEYTEDLMLDYILNHEGGIYYIYENKLNIIPTEFEGKKISKYLAAIELLTRYSKSSKKLFFLKKWLLQNQLYDSTWDMGASSKDNVYFPLSDKWDKQSRIKDCTYRVKRLLASIDNN